MWKNFVNAIICVSILGLAACSGDDSDADFNKNYNEAKAREVLESMESGDTSLIAKYLTDDLIQHNPNFLDGKQGFLDAVNSGELSGTDVRPWRIFTDGDLVVVHSEYLLYGVYQVGLDVFRFNAEGLIVEHWDNLQDRVDPTAAGRTMIDGTTGFVDDDRTAANKELARDFVTNVLIGRQTQDMSGYFDGDNLVQHSPQVTDGVAAWQQALEETPETRYTTLHQVIGEGNFVFTMSEGDISGTPTAFYDLFHIRNAQILEHWDIVSTIPSADEWRNSNGKF